MTVEDVENHAAKYSQAYRYDKNYHKKNSKWTTDFDAMALKTVIKLLLSKWGILSVEMQRALEDDQKIFDENGNAEYTDNPSGPVQDIDEPIDVFSEDVQEAPEEQEATEETSEERRFVPWWRACKIAAYKGWVKHSDSQKFREKYNFDALFKMCSYSASKHGKEVENEKRILLIAAIED